jgi:hypothetical protein
VAVEEQSRIGEEDFCLVGVAVMAVAAVFLLGGLLDNRRFGGV